MLCLPVWEVREVLRAEEPEAAPAVVDGVGESL